MNTHTRKVVAFRMIVVIILMTWICFNFNIAKGRNKKHHNHNHQPQAPGGGSKVINSGNPLQKKMCVPMDDTLRARYKTCFLRADTGPCRADILSWYFDARQRKCYRFFWGGCQGNGNRFETEKACQEHCIINASMPTMHIPYFCSLAFDFGNCFGHYNRWGWDPIGKTCKRRMYSGCGGNQNNFESKEECLLTCLVTPNNTMQRFHAYTTCIPFTIADLQ